MSTTLGKKTLHVLIFELEGQRHGLPVEAVREIVPMVSVVPLLQGPPTIEGVINIRGQVVPVLNARRRFGLPSRPARPTDHLIVAWAEDRLVALRVDRALDLIQVGRVEEDQSATPNARNGGWVAKLGNDLVLVHDLDMFLSGADAADLARPAEVPATRARLGSALREASHELSRL